MGLMKIKTINIYLRLFEQFSKGGNTSAYPDPHEEMTKAMSFAKTPVKNYLKSAVSNLIGIRCFRKTKYNGGLASYEREGYLETPPCYIPMWQRIVIMSARYEDSNIVSYVDIRKRYLTWKGKLRERRYVKFAKFASLVSSFFFSNKNAKNDFFLLFLKELNQNSRVSLERYSISVEENVSDVYVENHFIHTCLSDNPNNCLEFYDEYKNAKVLLVKKNDSVVARAILWEDVVGLVSKFTPSGRKSSKFVRAWMIDRMYSSDEEMFKLIRDNTDWFLGLVANSISADAKDIFVSENAERLYRVVSNDHIVSPIFKKINFDGYAFPYLDSFEEIGTVDPKGGEKFVFNVCALDKLKTLKTKTKSLLRIIDTEEIKFVMGYFGNRLYYQPTRHTVSDENWNALGDILTCPSCGLNREANRVFRAIDKTIMCDNCGVYSDYYDMLVPHHHAPTYTYSEKIEKFCWMPLDEVATTYKIIKRGAKDCVARYHGIKKELHHHKEMGLYLGECTDIEKLKRLLNGENEITIFDLTSSRLESLPRVIARNTPNSFEFAIDVAEEKMQRNTRAAIDKHISIGLELSETGSYTFLPVTYNLSTSEISIPADSDNDLPF